MFDVIHSSPLLLLVHGKWGQWTEWSPCSATCGEGLVQGRTRECDEPPPANGGSQCAGTRVQARDCDIPPSCDSK